MSQTPANAAHAAHTHIRAGILSGEYAAGSMLSESALAAALSVSRTPVRTALSRLQDEGFVTIYPKRGALVRELTAHEVREAAQVRHALETAGIQLADPGMRGDLEQRLRPNLGQQEIALADKDFHAFARLSLQFHRGFAELSDNTMMLAFYDRIQDRQYLSIVRNPTVSSSGGLLLDEHRALLTAAVAGDWVAFSTLLREHQSHGHTLE